MKTKILHFSLSFWLLFFLAFSCKEEHDDVLPGLFISIAEVESFPGDTIVISGTASNFIGLSKITFTNSKINLDGSYDLDNHQPKVFNFDYLIAIPKNALFENEEITVSAIDINGAETVKKVSLIYARDTQAPKIVSSIAEQINIDYNAVTQSAEWDINLKFTDNRELSKVRLEVPQLSIDVTNTLSRRSGELKYKVVFNERGEYAARITISDLEGNNTIAESTIKIADKEEEDPYSNYANMFIIQTDELPDNYFLGYYQFMKKTSDYQYKVNFYAPKDNTPIAFTAEKAINKDYWGASPITPTKLINKNGYVRPINIEKKGYYTIDIDVKNHTYSVKAFTPPSTTYGDVRITGSNYTTVADWAFSTPMTKADNDNSYRLGINVGVKANIEAKLSFKDLTANVMWKSNGDSWYTATSGANISFISASSNVVIIFDTATLWATVKKQ